MPSKKITCLKYLIDNNTSQFKDKKHFSFFVDDDIKNLRNVYDEYIKKHKNPPMLFHMVNFYETKTAIPYQDIEKDIARIFIHVSSFSQIKNYILDYFSNTNNTNNTNEHSLATQGLSTYNRRLMLNL